MTDKIIRVTIYSDGGARGNPGPAAIGAQIKINYPGQEQSKVVELSERIGNGTNNQAEYQAIVRALEETKIRVGESKIIIECYLDSLLVVSQINGIYKIKDANLRNYLLEVQHLINSFNGTCNFRHIRRESNLRADYLVNLALDRNS